MVVIRRTFVLGSCVLAVAVIAAATPRIAAACPMAPAPLQVGPVRADELLVEAGREIDEGDWAAAARIAHRVAESRRARADQRAQALAIVGWSAWRFGARARAISVFKRAFLFDTRGTSIEPILSRTHEPQRLAALRAALEA